MLKKIVGLLLFCSVLARAEMVEYKEDMYLQQASATLVDLVGQVANAIGFTAPYEVTEAKKAGLLINPWNRMISSGINPLTKNCFLIINSEWFNQLSKPEQMYLVGRALVLVQQGASSKIAQYYVPIFFTFLYWLLIFILLRGLSFTFLRDYNRWIKIAVAIAMAMGLSFIFLTPIQQKVIQKINFRHGANIDSLALTKLAKAELITPVDAVSALQAIDAAIKVGIQNGETAYQGYADVFTVYANEISKS